MRRGTIGPGELRTAEITKLPDGRYRVQRWKILSAGREDASAAFAVYGSADPVPARGVSGGAGNGVRLILQEIQEIDGKPHLHLVYETIPATGEIQAGLNTRIKLEDGREAIEAEFLQLSSDTYVPGTVGTTTAPGDASAYLKESVQTNDGTVRRIKRTYVYAGIIATDDESSNNGALLKKTITSVKTVPSTPSGFTLVGSPVQSPLGLPVYTYTYFKGIGEVSRRTSRSQCGTTTDGSVGVSRLDIEYLTAPAASEPIWSSVSGFIQIVVTRAERDGHMHWSAIYAKGAGLVAQSIDYDALPGLRRVTNISLGTKVTPTGVVVRDDYREEEGYRLFTVASWQTDTGGATPTSASVSAERYVSFTYPGRAKAFTETFDGKLMLAAFLSPPVTTQVKATITISYVTSNSLGTISDFWNPTEWATIKKQWVGSYGKQTSEIRALPGYRSVSATPVTFTGSGSDSAIEGSVIYNGTTASITITGGPASPGGSTWTLDARIDPEPVFTDTAGARYYRKTVITSAIPAQAALPV